MEEAACVTQTVSLKLSATPGSQTDEQDELTCRPHPPSFNILFYANTVYFFIFFNIHCYPILCDQCLIGQYKRELEAPLNLMAAVTQQMIHTAPINKSGLLR